MTAPRAADPVNTVTPPQAVFKDSMQSLDNKSQDGLSKLQRAKDILWRRKWQPTPVFLPGESQGRGSLVGCRLWGHTESDTTEVT